MFSVKKYECGSERRNRGDEKDRKKNRWRIDKDEWGKFKKNKKGDNEIDE